MKQYYKAALLRYWVVVPFLLWLVATEEQLAAGAVAGAAAESSSTWGGQGQLQLPLWVRPGDRRLLGMSVAGMAVDAVVAADGTGQYTTIKQAVKAAEADTSGRRYTIHVKAGKYVEDVEIWRPNITMIGDGIGRTIISGMKSKNKNRGTACTGTLNVQKDGFIARELTVENTAGPQAMQAAAVVVKSDRAVFFRCEITGYQDTLLADVYRQFYRECVISGTIDFVWGEATAVFQMCHLLVRRPLEGSHNTITAQGRNHSEPVVARSGFVFQECNVSTKEDLRGVDTYLGRPWHPDSRVIFMSSYLDGNVVNPKGWVAWRINNATDERSTASTVYYAEYNNTGAGANVTQRVNWHGFHLLAPHEVRNFTVDSFIDGGSWLPETNVPYHLDLDLGL
ncbi:probable pectinesterase/pectinesterase inhibitor 32 [Oryza sativa Japonica Group]|uniref:Pectinesterase n=3 Tax=Oryza TaxID=4527 RepID=Q0J784_ORYSJ|nr:probable pectinesterase/pectinesterase inhibitor 32 [Oryza sativa Japonica Group]KAF2918621.1 hypothetical protein DAI22_08g070500 [Oryza sativa Japonica Group]BAD03514.1 putative Pectinesterase 2.1 precursor [Oryza sativa Japonica Group]BAF23181.1 Os08g0220400 [Oryza sativa Japonica Group]BAG97877.1 unnamed protein product [Oryza sativa Japonica Group]BAT04366.1 Os08g0220400 [Oryza sativa Japonica Group]|eukprot:NP_001061267.1 Os08g0220400 [Oryza sativa Japonica Group]